MALTGWLTAAVGFGGLGCAATESNGDGEVADSSQPDARGADPRDATRMQPLDGSRSADDATRPPPSPADVDDQPVSDAGESAVDGAGTHPSDVGRPSPADASPRCGDGVCADDRAETCASCPIDCRCAAHEVCDEAALICRPACTPECDDRACGPDGCDGQCGACPDGRLCNDAAGRCECDPRLPPQWPADLSPWSHNPLLVATSDAALQGADNIYAPDIHRHSDAYVMWYGAQSADGHDSIYLAWSRTGMEWRKWPSDADPLPVLDRGGSNHINDPSLVRVNDVWHLYYTDAEVAENDRIWLARSDHLTGFEKIGEVLGVGPPDSWESQKTGRPSVLYEEGLFKLWYDATSPDGRHVGYATSQDGVHFERHPENPVFRNAGAIDVKRVGDVYVMLREAGDGTYWATSPDGVCWIDRGRLFGLSATSHDQHGQVTPFLWMQQDTVLGVWYGGASVPTWNHNRIAAAFPHGLAPADGGGCIACLPRGHGCASACSAGGSFCGIPGSIDPGACCVCEPDGCEACLAGAADCHAACVTIDTAGGWCDHPGSIDPGQCCACLQ